MSTSRCPNCGAQIDSETPCETYFHQMLFWESEVPALGVVHHYLVLCYYIQHPHLYSPEGLRFSIGELEEFIETDITAAQMREKIASDVNSRTRKFKIKGTPEAYGAYPQPVAWTMNAADVVARGRDHYIDSVSQWAKSVYDALKGTGQLS
jgi:hypothetical protein